MAKSQFCTFFLDKHFFGIEVTKIQEVIPSQNMTRVPLASRVIRGLINLRGQIVTTIDLRRRLELNERPNQQLAMNMVVRTNDGDAVSLLIDDIGDVLELDQDDFEAAPDTLKGVGRDLICGVYKLKNNLLLVLDVEKTVQVNHQ